MTVASVLSDRSDWNAPTLGNRVSGPRSQPLRARHLIETTARAFLPHPRHRSSALKSRTLAAGLSPTLSSAPASAALSGGRPRKSTGVLPRCSIETEVLGLVLAGAVQATPAAYPQTRLWQPMGSVQ
jgi:hypothetical protein